MLKKKKKSKNFNTLQDQIHYIEVTIFIVF